MPNVDTMHAWAGALASYPFEFLFRAGKITCAHAKQRYDGGDLGCRQSAQATYPVSGMHVCSPLWICQQRTRLLRIGVRLQQLGTYARCFIPSPSAWLGTQSYQA